MAILYFMCVFYVLAYSYWTKTAEIFELLRYSLNNGFIIARMSS